MLTAERLRELLHYDPLTGIFTRRIRTSNRHKVGDRAGTLAKGYVKIRVDGALLYAHRLAWLYMTGEWPPGEVDHRYGITDDNRWSELRLATREQQIANTKLWCNSSTGVKGVSLLRTGKFQAKITHQGKQIHLGNFATAELAGEAYATAAVKYHGEFARTP